MAQFCRSRSGGFTIRPCSSRTYVAREAPNRLPHLSLSDAHLHAPARQQRPCLGLVQRLERRHEESLRRKARSRGTVALWLRGEQSERSSGGCDAPAEKR